MDLHLERFLGGKTVPLERVKAIVALDTLNMSHFFSELGDVFDPEIRYQALLAELAQGAHLNVVLNDSNVVAYTQCHERDDGHYWFTSIQIHPSGRTPHVIRMLIRSVYDQLCGISTEVIKSGVHHSNLQSVNLHRRLGFELEGEIPGRLIYSTPRTRLLSTLSRYLK